MENDFQPVAYAAILLNGRAGYPCLFWGDLYGVNGPNGCRAASHGSNIAKLALTRKLYAYGKQREYFGDRSCIGWTREGNPKYCEGTGLAVIISKNSKQQTKRMSVGTQHSGERWIELLSSGSESVPIDDQGFGVFPIEANTGSGSVAVWVNSTAPGRERLDTTHLSI